LWFDSTTAPAASGRTGWRPHIRPRALAGRPFRVTAAVGC
jgi:hypothetical protein